MVEPWQLKLAVGVSVVLLANALSVAAVAEHPRSTALGSSAVASAVETVFAVIAAVAAVVTVVAAFVVATVVVVQLVVVVTVVVRLVVVITAAVV